TCKTQPSLRTEGSGKIRPALHHLPNQYELIRLNLNPSSTQHGESPAAPNQNAVRESLEVYVFNNGNIFSMFGCNKMKPFCSFESQY
ncbi:hypothetical protein NQ318_009918, partial [Aromia moschata]